MSFISKKKNAFLIFTLLFSVFALNYIAHASIPLPLTINPASADYDGDRKADLSVKTEGGRWHIDYAYNGFGQWDWVSTGYGGADALPVPADYDGDGKADLSVKVSDGRWLIDYAHNGFGRWDWMSTGYGGADALPVPADYDGDDKVDLAVKASNEQWHINYAHNGFNQWDWVSTGYGGADALPVPADYDGDGKADLSIKVNDGRWLIDYANNGFGQWDWMSTGYGAADALPVPADYDGDGKADLSVKAGNEQWHINYANNGFGSWDWVSTGYGGADALPVPADYDGDSKADLSVKVSDGRWLIDYAHNGFGQWDWMSTGYGTIALIPPSSPQDHWISTRAYLNQRALGVNGNAMCSMASIAMVRASAGLIGTDVVSLSNEAFKVWNMGLRGPGPNQVANYLRNNGMEASVIWTQDKILHWNEITEEINAGRPVILNSNGSGGNLTSSGHYVVVVGYQDSTDPKHRHVRVYDPFGEWTGYSFNPQKNDWDILVGKYDWNSTSPNEPEGVKGRFKLYPFSALGTIYSVKAKALQPASKISNPFLESPADPIFFPATEDIQIYEGHNQNPYSRQIYIPLTMR